MKNAYLVFQCEEMNTQGGLKDLHAAYASMDDVRQAAAYDEFANSEYIEILELPSMKVTRWVVGSDDDNSAGIRMGVIWKANFPRDSDDQKIERIMREAIKITKGE